MEVNRLVLEKMLLLSLHMLRLDKFVLTDKKSGSFKLKFFFSCYHFFKKIDIVYLQINLPFFNNNLFKNNNKKAFGSTKPKKNLGFLYL